MLEELVAEGRRVLVFSQFTGMLALIEKALDERAIRHVKLTGRTRKRDAVIDAFQSGDAPVFLISLKAGGTGLNLTAADTVIHYDPWWNPAVESQASRAGAPHRSGQAGVRLPPRRDRHGRGAHPRDAGAQATAGRRDRRGQGHGVRRIDGGTTCSGCSPNARRTGSEAAAQNSSRKPALRKCWVTYSCAARVS